MSAAETTVAFCGDVSPVAGDAPKVIQLMPIGPAVEGRDGRAWTMRDADAVVRASELPMVLDYEHATEVKAPKGEEAPAAGWISRLKVVRAGAGREPGIWAHVAWTERGRQSVASHEYRGISPVFLHRKDGEVVKLVNAALTNRPNLRMTAMNQHTNAAPAAPSLTAAERAACQATGITPEQFIASRNADDAERRTKEELTALQSRGMLAEAPRGFGAGSGLDENELAMCLRLNIDPKDFAATKAAG